MAWVIRCLFIQDRGVMGLGMRPGESKCSGHLHSLWWQRNIILYNVHTSSSSSFLSLNCSFFLYHRDPRSCFIIQASLSLRIWCGFLTTEMTGMYHEAASVSPLLTNIPQPAWLPSAGRADAQTLWWICVFFYFLNSNKLSSAPLAYVTFVPKKYHNLFSYLSTF